MRARYGPRATLPTILFLELYSLEEFFMRSFSAGLAALLLAVGALTACQNAADPTKTTAASNPPAAAKPAAPADGVRRVTVEEAQAAVANGTAVIVDARDAASYKTNHIKGSINIYAPEAVNRMNELPKDKLAIFYCS
jgi:3-mercaptopyruvate sulfurtransferase SseA